MGKNKYPLDDFEGLYREHMFLHHPLVPDSVKQSQSDIINIRDFINTQKLEKDDIKILLEHLQKYEAYSVIRLYNLHNVTLNRQELSWEPFQHILN